MLLRNLRLIDGTGAIHERTDIRVDQGRFLEIGPGLAARGDVSFDGEGRTAIPGLIDAHTHLSFNTTPHFREDAVGQPHPYQALLTAKRAEALLAQGVTTARDVGGVAPVIFAVRDAIRQGHIRGPRLFAAGHWITVTGGHGWPNGVEVDSPDALRRAAREAIKAGADLVKVMASGGVIGPGLGPQAVQFSEGEIRVAATEAHGAGLTLAAHAHGEGSIRNAVLGGVDTVEHGAFLTEALAQEMRRRGVFLVPTLAVIGILLARADEAGLSDHPDHSDERTRELREAHCRNVAMAHRLGVTIAAGTDMGVPFTGPDTIHQELVELAAVGLSPMEAIQAATRNAARALRLEHDLGTVEVGKRADLLVLDADPLVDLKATRAIRHILQDGEFVVQPG